MEPQKVHSYQARAQWEIRLLTSRLNWSRKKTWKLSPRGKKLNRKKNTIWEIEKRHSIQKQAFSNFVKDHWSKNKLWAKVRAIKVTFWQKILSR